MRTSEEVEETSWTAGGWAEEPRADVKKRREALAARRLRVRR